MASDLLSGKTLNNGDGDSVIGTMPNNGAVGGTITQQAGKVIIPAGYTSGGQVEANIINLTAVNIKQGANIGGVAGSFTADANAMAGDIMTMKTAYVNGVKVTGSMANRGAITQTISTQGGQYTVPAGYHNGSGQVTASFANLVSANVKSGVNIGGVIGSFSGQTATGAVYCTRDDYSTQLAVNTVNTIGFRPKFVVATFEIGMAGETWIISDYPFRMYKSGSFKNYYVMSVGVFNTGGSLGICESNPLTSTGWNAFIIYTHERGAGDTGTWNYTAIG